MYRMRKHREKIGLSLVDAATTVGIHYVNLHRIESGTQLPKAELARKLYRLYEGKVPLAAIYDPVFHFELSKLRRTSIFA